MRYRRVQYPSASELMIILSVALAAIIGNSIVFHAVATMVGVGKELESMFK